MASWLTLRVVSNSVKCSAKMVDHIYYLLISIPVLLKPKQKFCSRISPRKFFITTFFKTLINLFNKKFILGWAEESILIQRKNPVSSTNKRSVFKLIWCRSCFLASCFNEFRSKPCGKLCVSIMPECWIYYIDSQEGVKFHVMVFLFPFRHPDH